MNVKPRFAALVLLVVASLLLVGGSPQAQQPIDAMEGFAEELEQLKDQADSLLDRVRAVTVPSQLPPLWNEALLLELTAIPLIQEGLDTAQNHHDPSEVLKKVIIIFETFSVKLVKTIVLIKLTILQLEEEFGVPPGEPEPVIDLIIFLSGELEHLRHQGDTLLNDIETAGGLPDLPPLWAQALSLEEQSLPLLGEGISASLGVTNPSHLLKKKIIILEIWWIKVIDITCIAKLLILQLQEEFTQPPPPDWPVVLQVKGYGDSLRNIDHSADSLIDVVQAATQPDLLPTYWRDALVLEKQALPFFQMGLDDAMTVPDPSELLKKKVIILETWVEIVVMEICIVKMTILQIREEFGMPPGEPEPVIGSILALSDLLEDMDDQSDILIDEIRGTETILDIPPLWTDALDIEQQAIPVMDDGIDSTLTLPWPSELLTKKVVIFEAWAARLVTEISIAKLYILWFQEDCCRHRGNADGLIGVGGPVDVADLTYLVAYLFGGGPPPPCLEEGNIDGFQGPGGPIDVADLTYLVAFLFLTGPPPAPC